MFSYRKHFKYSLKPQHKTYEPKRSDTKMAQIAVIAIVLLSVINCDGTATVDDLERQLRLKDEKHEADIARLSAVIDRLQV